MAEHHPATPAGDSSLYTELTTLLEQLKNADSEVAVQRALMDKTTKKLKAGAWGSEWKKSKQANNKAAAQSDLLGRLQQLRYDMELKLIELVQISFDIQSRLISKRKQYIEELRRQLAAKQAFLQSHTHDPSVSTSKELEEFLEKQDLELSADIEDHRKRMSQISNPRESVTDIVKQETEMVTHLLTSWIAKRQTKASLIQQNILFDDSYESPDELLRLSADVDEIRQFEELCQKLDREHLLLRYKDLKKGDKIGEGAYAKVYQGWLNGRLVAIKKLRHFRAVKLKSFTREVTAMRLLDDCPHVVKMLGACTKAPQICIVMPFLKGGSIHDLIYKKKVRFSPQQALTICLDVALGMVSIHDKNLIHRDIGPHNLLMHPDENGKCLIGDFGITVTKNTKNPVPISPKGHPRYRSPEIFLKMPITKKVDVFAFGTAMYTLFHNRQPHEKLEDRVAAEMMARGELPEFDDTLPSSVKDLIHKCWEKEARNRPNFRSIVESLQKLQTNSAKLLVRSKSTGDVVAHHRLASEIRVM